VVEIRVPPLRARREDIPELVCFALRRMAQRYARPLPHLEAGVLERLISYNWPGNVRELLNRVERAVVLSPDGALGLEAFFPGDSRRVRAPEGGPTFADEKARFERQYLVGLLEAASGNVSAAARMAGKFRTDLYRLCSRHQIDPAAFRK
jgi:two-component system response regulator GlrR